MLLETVAIRPRSHRGSAPISAATAELLGTQLRTSSGVTLAQGCLNPDTGALSWERMCGLMRSPANIRVRQTAPPADGASATIDGHAIPLALANTMPGRVYAFLLAAADKGPVFPKNREICAGVGYAGSGSNHVGKWLRSLVEAGFIAIDEGARVRIVATGQVLSRRQCFSQQGSDMP